jgi:hypothetical protein
VAGSAKRGTGCGAISGELSARPMKLPVTPPATAATRPQITPSASMLEGHSISRIIPPSVESDAPPNSSRCVGPHSVTSWPKMRCQMSSSGKPISATPEHTRISTPPSGASSTPGNRRAVGPGDSVGRKIATSPAKKIRKSPTRMK